MVIGQSIALVWLPAIGIGNWTEKVSSFASETAVIVFFVLSGYFITASISGNRARHGRFRVLDYMLTRAIRIYPPLIFSAVLSTMIFAGMALADWPGVASALAFHGDLYSARTSVSVTPSDLVNMMMMQNGFLLMNGPLWSLYVEVKLYVAAGLLAFLIAGTPRTTVRCLVSAGILWLFSTFSLVNITYSQWFYVAWWVAGAVLFRFAAKRLGRDLRVWGTIGLLGMVIVFLSPIGAAIEGLRVIGVMTLSYSIFFRWRWTNAPMKRIAAYSYTLYVIHFPILILFYAAFVEMAGPAMPTATWRILVMVAGVAASFLGARRLAVILEDTATIRRLLSTPTAWAVKRFPP